MFQSNKLTVWVNNKHLSLHPTNVCHQNNHSCQESINLIVSTRKSLVKSRKCTQSIRITIRLLIKQSQECSTLRFWETRTATKTGIHLCCVLTAFLHRLMFKTHGQNSFDLSDLHTCVETLQQAGAVRDWVDLPESWGVSTNRGGGLGRRRAGVRVGAMMSILVRRQGWKPTLSYELKST